MCSRTNRTKKQLVTRSELAGTFQITLPLCFTNEETETDGRGKTKSSKVISLDIYIMAKLGLKPRLSVSKANELSLTPHSP